MKEKKIYIVLCILIIIFSASLTEKTFQNDTYALIALGRDMISNRLDGYDHLTFHENLRSAHTSIIFEILLYKVYDLFCYQGIYIFIMILSALNSIILFRFLLKRNNSKLISFIITIFAIYNSRFIFTARPTILVMPLFLIIVECIEKILETNKNKYCIILLISSVILINAHDVMWLVHFIFYFPVIAEQILVNFKLDRFVNKKIIIKKYKNIKKLLIILVLDLLCSFITLLPGTRIELIKELIYTVTGKLQISELSSTNIKSTLSLVIIMGFFIFQFISKHKNRIADLFMLLGLIILAIMGIRYGVFLYFIGSLYINKIINLIIKQYNLEEEFNKIDDMIFKFSGLIIIVLIFLIISIKNFENKIINQYISEVEFPVEICEYMKKHIDNKEIRVYNHFNFGAYLEFMEFPNFIDGRAGIYYQKYGETSIIDDFIRVEQEGEYKEVFEKYDITHAILYNTELVNEKIYNDDNFELLYQTDIFSLYSRK